MAPLPEVRLSVDEEALLKQGFISDGQQVGGGLAAAVIGFGVGQALQGRWFDTGWIFTLGDGGLTVVGTIGLFRAIEGDPRGIALLALSAAGGTAFRIWGTIDAFAGPRAHNARVRELRARVARPPFYARALPYVVPAAREGAVGGLSFAF
jgi:hypothetical protein